MRRFRIERVGKHLIHVLFVQDGHIPHLLGIMDKREAERLVKHLKDTVDELEKFVEDREA